jgi:hypothetical protein
VTCCCVLFPCFKSIYHEFLLFGASKFNRLAPYCLLSCSCTWAWFLIVLRCVIWDLAKQLYDRVQIFEMGIRPWVESITNMCKKEELIHQATKTSHSSQLKLKHDIWEIDCFSTFLNSSVRISRFSLCKLSQDDGPHKSIFKSEVTKIGCFSSPRLDVIPELLITYFVSYAPAYISKNKHDIHYKKIWFYFQLSRWDGVAGVRISLLPVMSCGGQCGEEAVAKDNLPWRTSPPVGKVRRRPWIKLKKIFLKRNCWIPKNVYCRNFVILNKTCKLTLALKHFSS